MSEGGASCAAGQGSDGKATGGQRRFFGEVVSPILSGGVISPFGVAAEAPGDVHLEEGGKSKLRGEKWRSSSSGFNLK